MSCNIGLVTIKALKLVWSLWQQIYNSYIETSQGSLKIDSLKQFEIDIGKMKQYCKIQVKKCESEYAIVCTNSHVCFPKDGRMWKEIYVFV